MMTKYLSVTKCISFYSSTMACYKSKQFNGYSSCSIHDDTNNYSPEWPIGYQALAIRERWTNVRLNEVTVGLLLLLSMSVIFLNECTS